MNHLKALVMMQLKDKLDFGFTATRQKLISKIVFTLLKFIIVAVVAFAFFYVCSMLAIFSIGGGVPKNVMVLIFAIIFLLSLFSCTVGLMKNLYFAEDNKMLVTLPVNGNLIFLSRLIVYYVYEMKRSLFLTIPIFIGFGIVSKMGVPYFIWLFIAFTFISALPVLIGALLSIPAMYIYRFLKKVPAVFALAYAAVIGVLVYAVIRVIAIIPENIDLVQQLGDIQNAMNVILQWSGRWLYPVNYLTDLICGVPTITLTGLTYGLFNLQTLSYFGITVGSIAALGAIVYLVSRPVFFVMMSKSFEFEKKQAKRIKPNRRKSRMFAFLSAEVANFARSGSVGSFIGVYIVVPVLIFLINKIFCAISTRTTGMHMVYAFNLLLILLPIMASNALVATLYSQDGRAGYIRKTFPVKPLLPLTVKLLPVIILSSISVCVSIAIFGNMVKFSALNTALLCVACVMMQVGHVFWCATLDLMNPQNEQYATTGEMNDNPNEKTATIIAFIVSAIFAFFSFVLFSDAFANSVMRAAIKLTVIGLVFVFLSIYMYVGKINVYYNEK